MNKLLLAAQALAMALIVLLPAATAQTQPSITITIREVPAKTTSTNETVLVPLNVHLGASNMVCTANARIRVAFGAIAALPENASANQSVAAVPSPPELTFVIQQGAYGNNAGLPAAQPYAQVQAATVGVTARNFTQPTNVTVATSANFVQGAVTECRGNGALMVTDAKASFVVGFGATSEKAPEPTPRMPLPSTLVLFALAAGLFMMRRRSA